MNFYTDLAAAYYDAFFECVDEQELDFWHRALAASASPALELGVGTGRILLPLLQRGLQVEGVDCSAVMLAQCKRKADALQLNPILYEQYIEHLQLSKQYGSIFCPLGTWQHIADRAAAQQTLTRCYEHLLPGGTLILYTYIPWYNAAEFGEWHALPEVTTQEGTTLRVEKKEIHDLLEQCIYATYRYCALRDGAVVATEEKELVTRWYSRFELQMMLEQAGFSGITVRSGYDDHGPQDMMIFSAVKSH
jgi:SAM-dependent methyltransferase